MSALSVNVDGIPTELKALPRWVLWRFGDPRRDGKRSKVPFTPNGKRAKVNDPTTCSSFEAVKAAFLDRSTGYDGIGFVLTSEDGFIAIDLDNCVGDDGTIALWAKRIMDALPIYWEFSPSGRGLRAFLRGTLPEGYGTGLNRALPSGGRIEIYQCGRYVTLTGAHVPDTPTTIERSQREFEALLAHALPRHSTGGGTMYDDPLPKGSSESWRLRDLATPPPVGTTMAADTALIERMRGERGRSFCLLFDDGNVDAYNGDDSAAEWALVNEFVRVCGPDPDRIERLTKLSALYRRPGRAQKWDARHSGDGRSYIRLSIENAITPRASSASRLGEADNATTDAFWQDSEPWPTLDDAAFYGPIGRAAKAISCQSEGDPVAILTTMLAAFGNAVGNGAHVRIGDQRHPARIFPCHVGQTARGRKGQAFTDGVSVIKRAAPEWYDEAFTNGLGSGEGLLEKLAGVQRSHGPSGVSARALVYEPEIARLSAVAGRDGSTLSAIIRDCFDRDRLGLVTRKNPITVNNAHVTMITQSTPDELKRCITSTEVANGFANRSMFFVVKRSQSLPFGGDFETAEMELLAQPIREALSHTANLHQISFASDAAKEWIRFYHSVDEGHGCGLAADLLARAEAHVLRLALIYALADASNMIRFDHLRAAQAVWKYSEASARHIFGDTLGDDIAQRLLDELRAVPRGLDRTAQHRLFQRHVPAARIGAAAKLLVNRGLATLVNEKTPGRARGVLYARAQATHDGE